MKQTQSKKVYELLKEEIVAWTVAPGAPLAEPELARRLGSSRTPIREALQQLAREGLVRTVPGRGSFVADISVNDVIELYQMRKVLESGAARLAAESANRARAEQLIERFSAAKHEINDQSNTTYYEVIADFDRAIIDLAVNQRLRQALHEVWAQMRRLRNIAALDPARLLATVDEHRAILEAILDGDAIAADQRTREHVDNSLQNVLNSIMRRPVGRSTSA